MKLFVYGTLLSGQKANYKLIDMGAVLIGPDKFRASMFTTNFVYPFISETESEDEVFGEVYEINDDVLVQSDYYEGFKPSEPESCLFIRSMGTTIGGHEVYYYHTGPLMARSIEVNNIQLFKIESGDWKTFYENEAPTYIAAIRRQQKEAKEAAHQARIIKYKQQRSEGKI